MTRITRRTVEKAIKDKYGWDVTLHRDPSGYHYFDSEDERSGLEMASWESTSVMVHRLNQLTLEQWVEIFGDMLHDNNSMAR